MQRGLGYILPLPTKFDVNVLARERGVDLLSSSRFWWNQFDTNRTRQEREALHDQHVIFTEARSRALENLVRSLNNHATDAGLPRTFKDLPINASGLAEYHAITTYRILVDMLAGEGLAIEGALPLPYDLTEQDRIIYAYFRYTPDMVTTLTEDIIGYNHPDDPGRERRFIKLAEQFLATQAASEEFMDHVLEHERDRYITDWNVDILELTPWEQIALVRGSPLA